MCSSVFMDEVYPESQNQAENLSVQLDFIANSFRFVFYDRGVCQAAVWSKLLRNEIWFFT